MNNKSTPETNCCGAQVDSNAKKTPPPVQRISIDRVQNGFTLTTDNADRTARDYGVAYHLPQYVFDTPAALAVAVGNLMQHGDIKTRAPELKVTLNQEPDSVCMIPQAEVTPAPVHYTAISTLNGNLRLFVKGKQSGRFYRKTREKGHNYSYTPEEMPKFYRDLTPVTRETFFTVLRAYRNSPRFTPFTMDDARQALIAELNKKHAQVLRCIVTERDTRAVHNWSIAPKDAPAPGYYECYLGDGKTVIVEVHGDSSTGVRPTEPVKSPILGYVVKDDYFPGLYLGESFNTWAEFVRKHRPHTFRPYDAPEPITPKTSFTLPPLEPTREGLFTGYISGFGDLEFRRFSDGSVYATESGRTFVSWEEFLAAFKIRSYFTKK